MPLHLSTRSGRRRGGEGRGVGGDRNESAEMEARDGDVGKPKRRRGSVDLQRFNGIILIVLGLREQLLLAGASICRQIKHLRRREIQTTNNFKMRENIAASERERERDDDVHPQIHQQEDYLCIRFISQKTSDYRRRFESVDTGLLEMSMIFGW
jgi:hypothetical protein